MSDIFDLAASAAEDFCLAESAEGFACTERPGHEGWHRAVESSSGRIWDTWPVGTSGSEQ